MKKIPLTQGEFAIVDDEDFESLSKFDWICNNGYGARARTKKDDFSKSGGLIMMHRQILGFPELSLSVDHINGKRNDNRKINLRLCTHQQNIANSKKRENSSSKYKGVNKHQKGWQAFIWVDGKNKHLGVFKKEQEIEAAKAYDKAAKEIHGEFAKLNFPEL